MSRRGPAIVLRIRQDPLPRPRLIWNDNVSFRPSLMKQPSDHPRNQHNLARHQSNNPRLCHIHPVVACGHCANMYREEKIRAFLHLAIGQIRMQFCHFSPHITAHLEPPVGSLGFCAFSICPITCSNDLATLMSLRALASTKAHLSLSANF